MELQEFLNIEKDYVYFYTVNNTCTMILVSNGKLITCYDFEFDNEKTILSTFMLVTSKYEQEYGINSITHYGFKSDQEIEIKLDLIKISK